MTGKREFLIAGVIAAPAVDAVHMLKTMIINKEELVYISSSISFLVASLSENAVAFAQTLERCRAYL